MDRIYVFLIRNDIWIYILCLLGLVWYISEFLRARRILRSAMFGLEIERGQRLQRRSLLFIFLFASLATLVIYVNRSIAPSLPAELLKPPTPTPNIFATPLSSPTPEGGPLLTATLAIAPTVTLSSSNSSSSNPDSPINPSEVTPESSTVTDTATPPIFPVNCSPNANISSPSNGSIVSSEVVIIGTANSEEFGWYDLEARGPQTGESWLSIIGQVETEMVFEDILGTANLGNWLPGIYNLRLTVFGGDGIPIGQCLIEVTLQPSNS